MAHIDNCHNPNRRFEIFCLPEKHGTQDSAAFVAENSIAAFFFDNKAKPIAGIGCRHNF
jgi:hypothetical protein